MRVFQLRTEQPTKYRRSLEFQAKGAKKLKASHAQKSEPAHQMLNIAKIFWCFYSWVPFLEDTNLSPTRIILFEQCPNLSFRNCTEATSIATSSASGVNLAIQIVTSVSESGRNPVEDLAFNPCTRVWPCTWCSQISTFLCRVVMKSVCLSRDALNLR